MLHSKVIFRSMTGPDNIGHVDSWRDEKKAEMQNALASSRPCKMLQKLEKS